MKIGISSNGKDLSSLLDMRFGRCDGFVIYDTESKTHFAVDNSAKDASGGAGIAAAQEMIDNDVEIVITGNMGPNAYNVCKNAEIKVYRCASVSIEKALQLFSGSKLEEIKEAGPAHAGMGGGGIGRSS